MSWPGMASTMTGTFGSGGGAASPAIESGRMIENMPWRSVGFSMICSEIEARGEI